MSAPRSFAMGESGYINDSEMFVFLSLTLSYIVKTAVSKLLGPQYQNTAILSIHNPHRRSHVGHSVEYSLLTEGDGTVLISLLVFLILEISHTSQKYCRTLSITV